MLLADPDLDSLLRWWELAPGGAGDVLCVDDSGRRHTVSLARRLGPQPAARVPPHWGTGDCVYRVVDGLASWLRDRAARPGDELCWCPQAPDARGFLISLEPRGAHRDEVREADEALAETALAILRAANTMVRPRDLLTRLAGRMDLPDGAGVHLPVFVLGRDPRFVFDGTFYGLRQVAEESLGLTFASPYPGPEEYPRGWSRADPVQELYRQVAAELPPAFSDGDGSGPPASVRALLADLPQALIRKMAAERVVTWDLLQGRSRQLARSGRTDGGRTGSRGRVIRGPWPV